MHDTRIVLATRNQGKIAELGLLLKPFNLEVLGLDSFPHVPDVEETGVTFAENALLKACAVAKATGLVAVADDSGLAVDVLNGAPGVYSARYSAEAGVPASDARNNVKLLNVLRDVAPEKRTGRFCCCMAACTPEGEHLTAHGFWEGRILEAPRGSNGFGYDPLFFDPECGETAAEMSRERKNERSHRARAVRELLRLWPDFWAKWIKES